MFNGRKPAPVAKQAPGAQHPHQHNPHVHAHPHHVHKVGEVSPTGHSHHQLPFRPNNTILPQASRFVPAPRPMLPVSSSVKMPETAKVVPKVTEVPVKAESVKRVVEVKKTTIEKKSAPKSSIKTNPSSSVKAVVQPWTPKQQLAITAGPALLAITDSPKGKRARKGGLNMMGHRLPWELLGKKGRFQKKINKKAIDKKAAGRVVRSPQTHLRAKQVQVNAVSPFDASFPQCSGSMSVRTRGYVAVSPFDSRFPKAEKLQSIFSPKKAIPRIDRTNRNGNRQRTIRRIKAYERSRIVMSQNENCPKKFKSASPWDSKWNEVVKRATERKANSIPFAGFVAVSPFDSNFERMCGCKEFTPCSPFDANFPNFKRIVKIGRAPRTKVVWQQRVVGYSPAVAGAVNLHTLPHGRMSALPTHRVASSSLKIHKTMGSKSIGGSTPKLSMKATSFKSFSSSGKRSVKVTRSLKGSESNGYSRAMQRIHDFYMKDDSSPLHRPVIESFPRFSPMAAKTVLHAQQVSFCIKSPVNSDRMNNVAPLSMLWA